MSGNMATIYNELMKVKIDINDLQRNVNSVFNDVHNIGNDVSSLNTFRDVYREDIISSVVGVKAAHDRIVDLNVGLATVDTKLNDFIKTFNDWAKVITQLQTDVAALKKENAELRSTTATVGKSSASSTNKK
jgi:uncharacterized protein YoxC